MLASTTPSLTFASQYIVIYIGFFIFTVGLIGGPLVLIVFLSLRTFRQSSCAFYLTIMSAVNTIHLFTGLLTYIMINGFCINWTDMSPFYCKFRSYYLQLCALTSFTCMCLATIDQFLATCSNPRWHQWNNIKFARYMVMGVVVIWLLHGIPFLMYYNHDLSSITGKSTCVITNVIFQRYFNIFHSSCLKIFIPITIMIIFAILACRNVQQTAYRTVPLIRRELDKQLTAMVFVHVFYNVLTVLPIFIQTICNIIIGTPNDSLTLIKLNLIRNITNILYYFHFVGSFYIYVIVSKRFRQQLIYVLFTIHLNWWRRRRVNNNQVEPHI